MRRLALYLTALGLGVFIVRVAAPLALGVSVVTIESGSMGEAMPVGSLAYLTPQPDYAVGDVVTYAGPTGTITHRIVASLGGGYYRVRGDANNAPDAELIGEKTILGRAVWVAPWLGLATHVLASPIVIAFVLLVALTLLVAVDRRQAQPAT